MSAGTRSACILVTSTAVIAIAYVACCQQVEDRPETFPRMSRAVFDLGPLLERGYTPDSMKSLIMGWTSGPWQVLDGEGGQVDVEGDQVVLFSTERNHRECREVLQWLGSPDEVAFIDPAVARAVAALDRRVVIDRQETPLGEVLKELGAAIDYPFCIYEGHAWPDPNERVNVSFVDAPAWHVCRELPSGYFPFDDHIGAVYVCDPVATSMKLQIDRLAGKDLDATLALANQLREAMPQEWAEINSDLSWGEGRMHVPKPGVILVTAPFRQIMEAREAWRNNAIGK